LPKRPRRPSAAKEALPYKYVFPLAALILLRVVVSYLPGAALWGLDFLRYVPSPMLFILTGLALLIAFDRRGILGNAVEKAAAFVFPESKARRIATLAAFSLAVIAVFSSFNIAYPFLGDGKHVGTTLYRILKGHTEAQAVLWNEPLTHLYYLFAFKTFSPETLTFDHVNLKGFYAVFRWTSYILGSIYVFSVFVLSGNIAKNALQRLALSLGILGCGGMLFYFGYLEYYAFLYLLGTLFLMTGLSDLKKRKAPIKSGIMLGLAIAFHLSAVVFLPAYMYLLADHFKNREAKSAFAPASVLKITMYVMGCCVAIYLALQFLDIQGFFIPLLPGDALWALLSVQHGFDVLNNLFIHAPFAVAVLVVFQLGKKANAWQSPELQFAGIAGLFWLALIVSHSAIARDWDVYALFGTSIAVMAFLMVQELAEAAARRYYMRQMVLQPILLLIPWLYINYVPAKAEIRFADVTDHYAEILPPDVTTGCYETLREYNANVKDVRDEIYFLSRVIEYDRSPYQYFKLSRTLRKSEQLDAPELAFVGRSMNEILLFPDTVLSAPAGTEGQSALTNLYDVYLMLALDRIKSTPADNRSTLIEQDLNRLVAAGGGGFTTGFVGGKMYAAIQDNEMARKWYFHALEDSSGARSSIKETVAQLYTVIALSFMQDQRTEESLAYFQKAVSHPTAKATDWSDYGYACYLMKQFDESRDAFEKVIRLNPNDSNALYCLGVMLLDSDGSRERGISFLERYIQLYPKSRKAQELRMLLEQGRRSMNAVPQ
jgi:tetratricopeptide (TPR) repeat protein